MTISQRSWQESTKYHSKMWEIRRTPQGDRAPDAAPHPRTIRDPFSQDTLGSPTPRAGLGLGLGHVAHPAAPAALNTGRLHWRRTALLGRWRGRGAGAHTVPSPTHHLLDSMKSFPVKTKGLLKQDFIFHSPLIWEGGKVGQISQWFFNIMLMPKEHPKSLEK